MTNLTILYLLNLIVLISGFISGLIKKRVYSILWLSLLAFHLVSLIDLSNLMDNHSMSTLVYGQELMLVANIFLFLMIVFLDYLILQQKLNPDNNITYEHEEKEIKKYIYFIILLFIVSFTIRFREGLSVLYISWEEVRDTSGIIDSFANMLCFIAAPVFWMVVKKRNYFLIVIFGLLFFLQIQISGSRAMLLVFGCSILLTLINSSYSYFKRISILAFFGFVMFLSHTLLRLIRGLSLAGLIIAMNTGFQSVTIEGIDLSGGESKIYSYYYYVLENDFDQYPFKSAVTLKRLGLLYLPTSVFPDIKPADITYQLWMAWVNEDMLLTKLFQYIEIPGSLHPMLWGDAYMNAGLLGMFLYPLLFGFIVIWIEYFLKTLSSLGFYAIAPIVGGGYMMIGRGNVVIGCGYIGYIIPIILLIMYILRIHIFNLRTVNIIGDVK
jgi:hypothetical protein